MEICSISDPLFVMSISSINARACGNSDSMESITLWNSAGIDVRPWNSVSNRYVPVDFPQNSEKLLCTLVSELSNNYPYAYVKSIVEE